MNLLKTGAFVALLTACYLHSPAQTNRPPINEPDYNKPKIFNDLPEMLSVRVTDMEALLNLPEGALVNKTVAPGLTLQGTIVSTSNPVDLSTRSVVIKSTNRQGASFTFTRIRQADGSFSYTGRMMSKSASDALVIVKEGSNYVIRKKAYFDIINE